MSEAGHPAHVCLDGSIVPVGEAVLSALDPGLLRGEGVFETMRADDGTVHRFAGHMARMRSGLTRLGLDIPDPEVIAAGIAALLERCALREGCVRVRVTVTGDIHGLPAGEPGKTRWCISAVRYHPPSDDAYRQGWVLPDIPCTMHTPLSSVKCTSYAAYRIAARDAREAGHDDALLCDAQGQLTETSTAALLLRIDQRWIAPISPAQLPSVTRPAVIDTLRREGETVIEQPVDIGGMHGIETMWALNALMGVMPVLRCGGWIFPEPRSVSASAIRRSLFTGSVAADQ